MRDKVNVLYYPDSLSDHLTLKKAILFFDEIHFMDRPSYSFEGGIGTIGMDSPLRGWEEKFRNDGVPLFVHKPASGRVGGAFQDDIAADINDPEFLARFQRGLVSSTIFRDLHIQHGEYGDPSANGVRRTHGEVAAYLGAVDVASALGSHATALSLLTDPQVPPYALADPSSCAKTLIFSAAACSAKMNYALRLGSQHGFVPLADAVPYGELMGAKYARAIGRLNSTEERIPLTDLSFAIFDELLSPERLANLTWEQVIRYRAESAGPREAFLEYLSVLQARVGRIKPNGNYADTIGALVRTEVLPAARDFRNRMHSVGEQLFGALAKGAIGAAAGAGGMLQLLGDISLAQMLGIGAAASAYIGKAAVDAVLATRAANRECTLSYLLSLDS
jgi:hypothetical protein